VLFVGVLIFYKGYFVKSVYESAYKSAYKSAYESAYKNAYNGHFVKKLARYDAIQY